MSLKPLPPLNSLVAFEAAARLGSFTLAGRELNVTQGAISRQVRLLEDHLHQDLFLREPRSISLTEAGTTYLETIQLSLGQIASATEALLENGSDKITIATSNAMATFWLLPRYGDFLQQHPEIDIRILTTDSLSQLRESEYDLGLFYCSTAPEHMHAECLFDEHVFPVCSPSYLEKHPGAAHEQSLSAETLLDVDGLQHEWVNWDSWLQSCGLPSSPKTSVRLNMTSYPLIVQAALNGQGVALAWGTLLDSYIESGLLLRPIERSLTTSASFYLLRQKQQRRDKNSTQLFEDWVLSQPDELRG